ncbi:CU044_5270 family protein [Arthrobacter celericrescens]|uniref:CU044_5270 family protein n=1 Tax=Arthrobacter celericrescens TaxID=2320851 RepID=UPI001FE13482|nr:CU044_5270 family protein [Arthrobacter celericrescens]
MRSDVGSAPQATLARGRKQLLSRIDAGTGGGMPDGGSRRRRTVTRRVLLASAAAAVLVGGIVVADVVAPAGKPGATAEAAEVLNNAAAAAIKASDPVVKPGQYLKVDTRAVYSHQVSRSNGTTVAWLATQDSQLYVPADKSGEWVWNRTPRVPTTFFGQEAKAEYQNQEAFREKNPDPREPRLDGIFRGRAGAFYDSPPQIMGTPLLEAIRTLPRDPRKLLDLIYEKNGDKGQTPESQALTTIADSLRTGVIPADLRAAMYKAAALIPGVVVADKQATLDGRKGIALGIHWAEGKIRQDIIIDPGTGLMIGERMVSLAALDGIPANTAFGWTAVKTSVVDSAP